MTTSSAQDVVLSTSTYQKRTQQLDQTNIKIDWSKLSILSKQYLSFKNIYGFRPLLIHPTVTSCLPYQAAREKRKQMITELQNKRSQIMAAIGVDIKDKIVAETQNNIAHYKALYNQETDTVKKMTYQSMINSEQSYLKSIENKQIITSDITHPDLLAVDEQIEKLKRAQLHIKNGGTCQGCGVTLPDSMEKHVDFLTAETRLLCPFCHLCEHIDEAAELRAGYIGYMPNISQEQINLFTYCYFILKYLLEADENLPEKVKEQLRAFAKRPISAKVEEITYEKLYQNIKSIRQTMKKTGNILIELFKHHANIDKAHLAKEYEEKNDTVIEGNIEDYLRLENRKYEDRQFTFESDHYYSANVDNMNLPEFYAGLMIAEGVSLYSASSIEEKLNVITRLDGIRFIPSYSFFKSYLDGWQKQLLTTGFEAMMADFFISFEEVLLIKEHQNQAQAAQNANTPSEPPKTENAQANNETPKKENSENNQRSFQEETQLAANKLKESLAKSAATAAATAQINTANGEQASEGQASDSDFKNHEGQEQPFGELDADESVNSKEELMSILTGMAEAPPPDVESIEFEDPMSFGEANALEDESQFEE